MKPTENNLTHQECSNAVFIEISKMFNSSSKKKKVFGNKYFCILRKKSVDCSMRMFPP